MKHDKVGSFAGFLSLGIAASVAALASAETLLRKGDELSVANAEAAVQTETVRMTPYARGIEKTGAGTYTLPRGAVDAKDPFDVRVREGRLALADGGSLPDEEPPTDLLNLATFWVDASVNTVNYTDEPNRIAAWFDCREVRDANGDFGASYASAETIASPKDGGGAVYATACPQRVTLPGMTLPMVYFGGVATGTGMNFRQAAKRSEKQTYDSVRHLFAVVCFRDSYGFVFGANGGQPILHPSAYLATTGLAGVKYGNADTYLNTPNGEFLVNGVRLNVIRDEVRPGLQLIELHGDSHRPLTQLATFFNDRNINGRYGGDYIGEVLVYNGSAKSLTAAERHRVQRYLMRKWGIAAPRGTAAVQVAEGAEAELTADVPAAFSGHGTLVKTGGETATYRPVDENRMAGLALSVEEGKVIADVRELNYAAKPGDAVSETHDKFMRRTLTVANDPAAAAEGKVTFTGGADAAVRLGALDPAVSNVTADCTELILGAAGLDGARLAAGPGSATIANASFEDGFSDADWVWVSKDGSSARKSLTTNGDVEDWRIAGAGDDLANFRANFRHSNFYATDGDYALLLKQANALYGHVKVAADGDYLFGFDGTGRYKYDNMAMTFSLIDENGTTNTFARCSLAIGDGFRPYRFVARGLKAGEYKLLIETANGYSEKGFSGDSHAALDNLRLDLLAAGPSNDGAVDVPNGSFENTRFTSSSRNVTTFGVSQLESAGWSFTSPNGTDAAPISRLMSGNYVAQDLPYGEWRLWFNGDAGRATSAAFTLPAGVWQLRCKLAKWSFANNPWNERAGRSVTPSLGVRCLVNGEERFDARQDVTVYRFTTVVLTNFLDVAATDRIVLELRQATANGNGTAAQMSVDDLEFVPAGTDADLIVNGSVEKDHPPWVMGSNAWRTDFTDSPNNDYGNYRFSGNGMIQVVMKGNFHQTVDFPAAGLYRLSFWARSRVSNYGGNLSTSAFGGGRILASLVDGEGKSTRIVETPRLLSTNFFETVALFKVPAKGKYQVRFDGIDEGDKTEFLDAFSVKAVRDAPPPAVSGDLALQLSAGSRLRLDFDGELTVGRLKIGNRKFRGRFDASDPSGLFAGPGVLNVADPVPGLLLILH